MKIKSYISDYIVRVVVGGRQSQRDNIRNKSIILHGHTNYRVLNKQGIQNNERPIRAPFLTPAVENIFVSKLHSQEVIIHDST